MFWLGRVGNVENIHPVAVSVSRVFQRMRRSRLMMSVRRIENSVLDAQAVAAAVELDRGDLLRVGRIANVANRNAAFSPGAGIQVTVGDNARLGFADSHNGDMSQLRWIGDVDNLHSEPALSDKRVLIFQRDSGRELNGVVMRQQFWGRSVRNIDDE